MITLSSLMQPGRTAVVTGAASGIGKAACLAFAQAGMSVWMIDNDAADLQHAQQDIQQIVTATTTTTTNNNNHNHSSATVVTRVLDVTDRDAMERLAQDVYHATGGAGAGAGDCAILFNNAGTGRNAGPPSAMDPTVLDRIMQVNTYGPIYGCQAFVPKMKEQQQQAMIINTGSKQGITCPPGNEAYNMSKAALKVYTEGLQHELRQSDSKNHIRVVLLIPGWVHTKIHVKAVRDEQQAKKEEKEQSGSGSGSGDVTQEMEHNEDQVPAGAWHPSQVIDFMKEHLDHGPPESFYIVCPDGEVDWATDRCRMTWAVQDVTENRPPRSRWHPDYAAAFVTYLNDHHHKDDSSRK